MSASDHPDQGARVALPGDNTAVASRRLSAGQRVTLNARRLLLRDSVPVGHRFALGKIRRGEHLTSWGLPFGVALGDIPAGAYLCNASVLEALKLRGIQIDASSPNFSDIRPHFEIGPGSFKPAPPLSASEEASTFMGFKHGAARGAGTRNYILLLGTTSETAGFVTRLETNLAGLAEDYPNIDGIVAVAHTEGSVPAANNRDHLLRCLAGFMVHPNIGGVLAVDYGWEPVNNAHLERFLHQNDYPISEVPHAFLSLTEGFDTGLKEAESTVKRWLPIVDQIRREELPVSELRLALQCGGSDTFSGISGNPLVAELSKRVIQDGGAALLGETTELIGAESYLLQKAADLQTVERFLAKVQGIKSLAAWHGESVEQNVSQGNKIRGLYNITLKSIGAARKRHPDVRLEGVIEYAEVLTKPGLTFMNSPGSDLESVAGQVASGCNMILFTTGNGSVTNFPFVPTLKVITTTERHRMLRDEMDINAGRYLEGESMESLAAESFDLLLQVASGRRSKGERAGHAQTLIWRNWEQSGPDSLELPEFVEEPSREPIPFQAQGTPEKRRLLAWHNRGGWATERLGLILPASLCSAQVARLAADQLNALQPTAFGGIAKFVSLPHSEGCTTLGPAEKLATRTLLGHLAHPMIHSALVLEHGCEKTHNAYLRMRMAEMGLNPDAYGWASVQLDGGMQSTLAKIEAWFRAERDPDGGERRPVGLESLNLGLTSFGPVTSEAAQGLAALTRQFLVAGGRCVISGNASLLKTRAFMHALEAREAIKPNLPYGGRPEAPGLYRMQTPSTHVVETLTGLGAAGPHVIVAYSDARPVHAHPFIPVLHIGAQAAGRQPQGLDLVLDSQASPPLAASRMMDRIFDVLAGKYLPQAQRDGDIQFQLARGPQGISL